MLLLLLSCQFPYEKFIYFCFRLFLAYSREGFSSGQIRDKGICEYDVITVITGILALNQMTSLLG